MVRATAKGFPAKEPPQGRTQRLHKKQKQTDQMTVESNAGESNSGIGVYKAVYKADLINRSILDEAAIPSDGPITICAARSISLLVRTKCFGSHLEQAQNERERERERVWVAISHCKLRVSICELQRSLMICVSSLKWRCIAYVRSLPKRGIDLAVTHYRWMHREGAPQ